MPGTAIGRMMDTRQRTTRQAGVPSGICQAWALWRRCKWVLLHQDSSCRVSHELSTESESPEAPRVSGTAGRVLIRTVAGMLDRGASASWATVEEPASVGSGRPGQISGDTGRLAGAMAPPEVPGPAVPRCLRAATLRIYIPIGTCLNRCAPVCGGIRLSGQVAQFDRPFPGALGHAGMKDDGQLYAGCWPCRPETAPRQPMRLSALGELDGGATSVVRPMVSMNQDRNVRYPEPGTRKPGIDCSNPLLSMPAHDGPGGRPGRPTWVGRACPLPCWKGVTLARRFCSSNGVQLGVGEPPGTTNRHRLPRFPSPRPGHRQPRGSRAMPITARNDLALRMAPCPMQRVDYRRA